MRQTRAEVRLQSDTTVTVIHPKAIGPTCTSTREPSVYSSEGGQGRMNN